MKFQNTIEFIISELSELNSILKKYNIDTKVDIKGVIQKIIETEKDHCILKYNVKHAESKLEENIDLLKSKLDLEYQIYNILTEHKTRIKKLQEDNDLPEINGFIEKMFDISNESILQELNLSFKSKKPKKDSLSSNMPPPPPPPSSLQEPPPPPRKTSSLSNKSKSSNKPFINCNDLQSQLSAAIASRKKKCDEA